MPFLKGIAGFILKKSIKKADTRRKAGKDILNGLMTDLN